MDIKIFSDLLECVSDLEVLYCETNKQTLRLDFANNLTKLIEKEKEQNIYLLTTDGELVIKINIITSSRKDKPRLSFKFLIENNLRNVPYNDLKDMVEQQLKNEAFLLGVKSDDVLINQFI